MKKTMIYRETIWFTEKNNYLARNTMIYRETLWFTEKNNDFPRKTIIFREMQNTKMPLRFVFLKKTDSFQNKKKTDSFTNLPNTLLSVLSLSHTQLISVLSHFSLVNGRNGRRDTIFAFFHYALCFFFVLACILLKY